MSIEPPGSDTDLALEAAGAADRAMMTAVDALRHGADPRAIEAEAAAAIAGQVESVTVALSHPGGAALRKGELVVIRASGRTRAVAGEPGRQAAFRVARTGIVGFDTVDEQVQAGHAVLRLRARAMQVLAGVEPWNGPTIHAAVRSLTGVVVDPLEPDAGVSYLEVVVAPSVRCRLVIGDMIRRGSAGEIVPLTRMALRLWA